MILTFCNDVHRSSMGVVFTTFTIFSYIKQSVGNMSSWKLMALFFYSFSRFLKNYICFNYASECQVWNPNFGNQVPIGYNLINPEHISYKRNEYAAQ